MLQGKRGLIVGLANANSIAWGIAEAAHKQGAELGFTYLNSAIEKRMRPLAESLKADFIYPCDVNDEASLEALFAGIKEKWGKLDFVIHSVAFAQGEDLKGRFSETSREGFKIAMETSVYSLVALAQRAVPLMDEGGSLLTLSYFGSEKVVQNYNVMGVAKAALEAEGKLKEAEDKLTELTGVKETLEQEAAGLKTKGIEVIYYSMLESEGTAITKEEWQEIESGMENITKEI